jgi:protein-S-isoprenylcysteine O-methyltransferase Ste14
MSPALEDRLGRLAMVAIFSVVLVRKVASVMALLRSDPGTAAELLRLAQDGLSLAFAALVVVMTIRRLPATHGPSGLEPRITAIAGTYALIFLVALPSGDAPLLARQTGVALMAIGLVGSIYALWHLGRAFSIAPTARELVTSGPYGIVRHPLYITEGITTLGIIIGFWSWPAVLLGLVQTALQYRRIAHEEHVLREAFPESYGDYAARVPQLLPRLARA